MQTKTVVQEIAALTGAIKRCVEDGNREWEERHETILSWLESQFLPSGSGIDCGTKIDRMATTDSKVVLTFSFHHMDEHGGYDGWTDYKAIITPSFRGVNIRIVGRDRNGIKDYLHETFSFSLEQICYRVAEDGVAEYGRYWNKEWKAR